MASLNLFSIFDWKVTLKITIPPFKERGKVRGGGEGGGGVEGLPRNCVNYIEMGSPTWDDIFFLA